MTSRRVTPVYEQAPPHAPDRAVELVAVETVRDGARDSDGVGQAQPLFARPQAPYGDPSAGADLARDAALPAAVAANAATTNGVAHAGLNGGMPVHRHVAAANALLEPVRPGLERVEQR
ncbi:MAG: hypothetical protein ACRC1H_07685, partial [Caldilineaceae bacterium]